MNNSVKVEKRKLTKVTEENSLATNIELCKEWHYERNGNLMPSQFRRSSNIIVWWKCQICGFEWEESIANRNKGYGNCLKCRSLGIKNPNIALLWHPTKNGVLTIYDVTIKSAKKVWWKCPICGYEWEWVIAFTKKCPHCADLENQKLSSKNRLSIINTELCKEWNYEKNYPLLPSKIHACSRKKVWWKCPICGYEWEDTVSNRNKGYGKCLKCILAIKSLAIINPELSKLWHPTKNGKLTPDDIIFSSSKTISWQCPDCNYEWEEQPLKNPKCPKCHPKPKISPLRKTGRRSKLSDKNRLSIVNPELCKEWNYKKNIKGPECYGCGSSQKVHWKCSICGCEWLAEIKQRDHANNGMGSGCPDCNKNILDDGTKWDSYAEVYWYLKFKSTGLKIIPHKMYGFGKSKCDMYIPELDLYFETTSYSKEMLSKKWLHAPKWFGYLRKIVKKRKYVREVLKANFLFKQVKITKEIVSFIKPHIKQNPNLSVA